MKKMYSSNTELINSETIFFFFSSKKYTLYTAWNPAIRILFNVPRDTHTKKIKSKFFSKQSRKVLIKHYFAKMRIAEKVAAWKRY